MIDEKDVEQEIERYKLTNDVKVLNAVDDYARGLITARELYDFVNKRKTELEMTSKKVEKLDELLDEKLEREYNTFYNSMKNKLPEEIIERAYEITVKEEMKDIIKNMDLHDKEKAIMINQDQLLDEFYHDWLNTDVALGDSMKECIEESVATITRYYGKQNPFRVQKGR